MTTGPRSQCDTCTRYRSPFHPANTRELTSPFCAAFPDGIPKQVLYNGLDHRYPVDGDHGLRWESNGEPFPDEGFQPEFLHRGSS